jgi:hypothetical protein
MTIFTWSLKWPWTALILFLCTTVIIGAQSRLDFGQELLRQGDYFRATTVFKEVAYFTQDPLEKDQSLLLEGLSYLLSNRPDLTEVALEQRSRPSAQEFLLRILSAVQRDRASLKPIFKPNEKRPREREIRSPFPKPGPYAPRRRYGGF